MRPAPNRELAQACWIGVVILVLMILSGLRPMPRLGKGLACPAQKEPMIAAPLLSSGSIPDSQALHRITFQGEGREPGLPLAASQVPQFRAPRPAELNPAVQVLAKADGNRERESQPAASTSGGE